MMKRLFFVCLLISGLHSVHAQRFAKEIAAFKSQDSVSFPAKKAILLTGSSSFRLWKDVQQDFPGHSIVNRGFGGSTLPEMIRYAPDIIYPYHARQVVIYCGENDFADSNHLEPSVVAQRFFDLFRMIRENDRKVAIAYVSMKPSPSRQALLPKYIAANALIKEFLQDKKRTAYIDVYHAMLNPDGSIMADLFLEDKLHMNRKGYVIWQKLIEPHLLK